MLRVLFLNHGGQLGGGELSLLDLATHLPGCRVLLFQDGPFQRRLAEAGVDVQVLAAAAPILAVRRGSRLQALTALPGIAALASQVALAARGFAIIHCNSQKAFVVGSIAGLLARRPVIWHLRDMLTHSAFSGLNRRVTVALANRLARLVITNSRATAHAFAAVGGNSRKTAVLYNGVSQTEPAAAGAAADWPDRSPVLGCFSRLAPWKGQHILVEAAAMLRPRYPDMLVLIAGSPLFGEEAYEAELRRKVAALGLQQQVRFLGFRTDVLDLMAGCDIIVHTSIEPEPFGRVIIEGQLAGRPVIATDGGGAAELIRHGENGLLVPPGDAGAFAAAVECLLADRAAAARIAERGREQALREFTVERMVLRFVGLIEAVQGGGERGGGKRGDCP